MVEVVKELTPTWCMWDMHTIMQQLCEAYQSMLQLTADMLLKDLAIWLGKYVGVTLAHPAKIEEYVAHALAKMVHSSTS